MGVPMATNLSRAGFDVTGVDPDPAARDRAARAGVPTRASLDDGPLDHDVVISMLPSSQVTLAVVSQALPLLAAGTTWIDMGSNGPDLAKSLVSMVGEAHVDLLEAPVGGGPTEADRAELQLYVGGEAEVLTAQWPVLAALTEPENIHHLGPAGHGYLAKLLVNLLWFSQAVTTTEAMLLAGRADLDLQRFQDALAHSAVRGRFVDHDVSALLEGDYLASFGLAGCVEELAMLESLATELDTPFDVSAVVSRTYRDALNTFGPVDGELLAAAFLERRAGVVLHDRLRHNRKVGADAAVLTTPERR